MFSIKVFVTFPPPNASKRQSNPSLSTYSLNLAYQSPFVIRTFSAPSFLNTYACYSLLTIFNSGIFYFWHNLFNILPRADAAAVWMIPFNFLYLHISTIPIVVSGLTIPELADWRETSSSI